MRAGMGRGYAHSGTLGRMRCPLCEATVEIAGVFPGARVKCAGCGTEVQVGGASRRSAPPQVDAPYRVPSTLPVEPADAPARPKKSGPVCPRCAASLEGSPGHDGLLACTDCGGVFVSHDELDAALERQKKSASLDARAGAPSTADEVRYLACPICGDRMNRSLFGKRSGIVVDVCKMHGTWFDADELTHAARFLDAQAKQSGARLADRGPGALSPAQTRARAELEVLMMKESLDDNRRTYRQGAEAIEWLDLLIDVLTWR